MRSSMFTMPMLLGIIACTSLPTPRTPNEAPARRTALGRTALITLPLLFESNQGQAERKYSHIARRKQYAVLFGENETAFSLGGVVDRDAQTGTWTESPIVNVRTTLVGGRDAKAQASESERATVRWRGRVISAFHVIAYKGVYDGIDLTYHNEGGELHYRFDVAANTDHRAIRWRFDGATPEIDKQGDLVLRTKAGVMRHTRPRAFQLINGQTQELSIRFVQAGRRDVGFAVSGRVNSAPLIIDPEVVFAAFVGGSGSESQCCINYAGLGVVVNEPNHVTIAGTTRSTDLPTTNNTGLTGDVMPARPDGFIARYDASGSTPQLVYLSYFGGVLSDFVSDVEPAPNGDVYVTGTTTSFDFPTTPGAHRRSIEYPYEWTGFIARVDPTGALTAATFIGNGATEVRLDRASVDTVGGVDYTPGLYISGSAGPNQATDNAAQRTHAGGGFDAVVGKMSLDLTTLQYLTYIGGTGIDHGASVAPRNGRAYIVGYTDSGTSFPHVNAAQPAPGGLRDGFMAVIDRTGGVREYATYVGGAADDILTDIGIDAQGRVTMTGAHDTPAGGDFDVVKLTSDLQTLTRLDPWPAHALKPSGVAIDQDGRAHIVGSTSGGGLATSSALQSTPRGGGDAFFTIADPAGTRPYFTYLGGSSFDMGVAVAIAKDESIYIAGETSSDDFGGVADTNSGQEDIFLIKLTPFYPVPDIVLEKFENTEPATTGQEFRYTVNVLSEAGTTTTGVIVYDDVPAGLTINSIPQWCTRNGNAVQCNIGELDPDESRVIHIRVTAQTVGIYCNVARVVAERAQEIATQQCTRVIGPDGLIVEKIGTPTAPLQGLVTYQVTIENPRATPVTNVRLRDYVTPAKMVLLRSAVSNAGGAPCGVTESEVICELGTLTSQTVTVSITGEAYQPGTAVNRAEVTSVSPAATVMDEATTIIAPVDADFSVALERTSEPDGNLTWFFYDVRVTQINTPPNPVQQLAMDILLQLDPGQTLVDAAVYWSDPIGRSVCGPGRAGPLADSFLFSCNLSPNYTNPVPTPGTEWWLSLRLPGSAAGRLLKVRVTGPINDPNPANNCAVWPAAVCTWP